MITSNSKESSVDIICEGPDSKIVIRPARSMDDHEYVLPVLWRTAYVRLNEILSDSGVERTRTKVYDDRAEIGFKTKYEGQVRNLLSNYEPAPPHKPARAA